MRWSQACHSHTTFPVVLPVGLISTTESNSQGPSTDSRPRPAAMISSAVLSSHTINSTLPLTPIDKRLVLSDDHRVEPSVVIEVADGQTPTEM